MHNNLEELDLFIATVKKVKSPRKHKINSSLGVTSCFKWLKENNIDLKQKLTSKQFSDIIREVNKEIGETLLSSKEVLLPHRMGLLEIRKLDTKVLYKQDKLIVTNPIDWNATLKLWYEDEEAKKNKQTIKVEEKEIFRFYYNRLRAKYKNQSYFNIKFNRNLKLKLKDRIQQGSIDAYLLR